jgi:hypothetical protein
MPQAHAAHQDLPEEVAATDHRAEDRFFPQPLPHDDENGPRRTSNRRSRWTTKRL